jgi:hypothetical protein
MERSIPELGEPSMEVDNRKLFEAHKQPNGRYQNCSPYTNPELTLDDGDSFYVFTDGYPDHRK